LYQLDFYCAANRTGFTACVSSVIKDIKTLLERKTDKQN